MKDVKAKKEGDDGDMAAKFKKKQQDGESSDEEMPAYDPTNPFAALAALKKVK